jgi:ribosomal protein S18 acetylase RimI-like enzyme
MFTLVQTLDRAPCDPAAVDGRWVPLTEALVGAAHALVTEAFSDLPGAMVPPLAEFARHALGHSPTLEILLDAEGHAMGFVRVTCVGVEHGELSSLGVARAYRGRGLGRAVVQHGLSRLHALGARHVTLEVAATNDRALALYTRCGFTPGGGVGATPAEVPVYRRPLR